MDVDLPKEYDVIVVGTGLVECIVAAASARIGKKVLHIDRNDYYGGQWASFTLQGIEQWVTNALDLKDQPESIENETCELEEGERLLATCEPSRAYHNVKQQWYITNCNDESRPPTTEASCKDSVGAEQKTDECDTPKEATLEEGKVEEENVAEPVVKEVPSAPSAEINKGHTWTQESMMKLSRKFNLDMAPKLLFSRGSFVELLISSNVARYAEFKCITRVLSWLSSAGEEGDLVVVPCSRSDVFTTNSVSLVEKRLLMKLLEFCHSYDQHPDQLEEFKDKTFLDFLKSRRQTPNLIHFVTESIAMVDGSVSCREGLEKTKLFLTSLGRYGTTPFLFSMYGCGELPQAFCRLCAVFEGTYVLRRLVSSIILNADNKCVGLVSEQEQFKCSNLVMDAFYAPSQYFSVDKESPSKSISRGIFIIDKSIMVNEKEQLTLLRLPVAGGNKKPVTVIEVGLGSGICPRDLYCVHMTCQGNDAEDDLRVAVDRLFSSEPGSSNKPNLLWSLYFNQVDLSGTDNMKGVPENVYLCTGPDANLDYDSAISQARSVFTRMFPDDEFLPRAPDPDEIVFDNAGAEPKSGDNFSSEENADKKEETKEETEETEEETQVSSESTSTEASEKTDRDGDITHKNLDVEDSPSPSL